MIWVTCQRMEYIKKLFGKHRYLTVFFFCLIISMQCEKVAIWQLYEVRKGVFEAMKKKI